MTIAIEKGIIRSKCIIVDATHSLSRSNPYSALEVSQERSKLLRKAVYAIDEDMKGRYAGKEHNRGIGKRNGLLPRLGADHPLCQIPAVKEKLNLLKETVADTQEHYTLSKDRDAKTGHKSAESSLFGYKTHLAMTEERIITAAVVTSGEKGDGPELPKLLEISQQNGIEVDAVIGDSAYSGKENLTLLNGQGIKVVAKLNPTITQGYRKEEDKFDYNKDAGMFVFPGGHLAIRKPAKERRTEGKTRQIRITLTLRNAKYAH